MPEDQLSVLPPEVRQMVMTGTTAMMNGAGPNPSMMGPGVMMDMSGMMGPIMGGDMGMGGPMMQVDGRTMMPDGGQVYQGGVVVGNATPEQVAGNVSMMQEGFNGGQPQGAMMNMGMGGADFGLQVCIYSHNTLFVFTNFFKPPGTKPYGPTDVPYHGSPACGGTRSYRRKGSSTCILPCTRARHGSWTWISWEGSWTRIWGRWWYV